MNFKRLNTGTPDFREEVDRGYEAALQRQAEQTQTRDRSLILAGAAGVTALGAIVALAPVATVAAAGALAYAAAGNALFQQFKKSFLDRKADIGVIENDLHKQQDRIEDNTSLFARIKNRVAALSETPTQTTKTRFSMK